MIKVKFLNPFISVLEPGSSKTHHTADKPLDDCAVTASITLTLLNEPSLEGSERNVQTFKGVVQIENFALDMENLRKIMCGSINSTCQT